MMLFAQSMPGRMVAAILTLHAIVASTASAITCGATIPADTTYELTDTDVANLSACSWSTSFGIKLGSGATLNGANKVINGPTPVACSSEDGGCPQENAGILIEGVCGARVHNLTVNGFRYGVSVKFASCSGGAANVIERVTTGGNGNHSAHQGYGIKIADSANVQIKGVTVQNSADEGIHLGQASGVVFSAAGSGCGAVQNTIKDSYRENLYVLNSNGNTFANIQASYPASPTSCASGRCIGAFVENSSLNSFSASGYSHFGIKLVGDADANALGLDGTNLGLTAKRIEFESRDYAGTDRRPNGNRMRNVTVDGQGNDCIVFSENGTVAQPFDNSAVSAGVLQNCGQFEVEATVATTDGSAMNDLCAFTCPPDSICNESDDDGIVRFRRANSVFECP